MYILFYLTVAYYIIQPKDKDRDILRWVSFIFITSMALDELRQVRYVKQVLNCYLSDVNVTLMSPNPIS